MIENFGKATNSKLNIQKTKVYGFGLWRDRVNWPIARLKIEVDHFSTLGIHDCESITILIGYCTVRHL